MFEMTSPEQTPLNVLIVDDDEIMREVLTVLLAAVGHAISAAETADQATKLLASDKKPDVVLTDLHLPGIEASDLVKALRQTALPQAVLLAMSGSEPTVELRALLDGFLLKPFSAEDFHEALETARRRERDCSTSKVAEETPAAPANEAPVLDMATYHKLAAAMPAAALPDLYRITLEDVGKRANAAREAFARGDMAVCRDEGHTIKGGCGMVGAMELAVLGKAIEAGAAVDTLMLNEIAAASTRLRRMLDTLSCSPNVP